MMHSGFCTYNVETMVKGHTYYCISKSYGIVDKKALGKIFEMKYRKSGSLDSSLERHVSLVFQVRVHDSWATVCLPIPEKLMHSLIQ